MTDTWGLSESLALASSLSHAGRFSPALEGMMDVGVHETDGETGRSTLGWVMTDMPADLCEFLLTRVTSFVKWDLILFFHDNPQTMDTAENIARYIGRDVEAAKADLADLASHGVLAQSWVGEMAVYALNGDREIRDLVRRFVRASSDPQFRVKAVYYIIRGLRRADDAGAVGPRSL